MKIVTKIEISPKAGLIVGEWSPLPDDDSHVTRCYYRPERENIMKESKNAAQAAQENTAAAALQTVDPDDVDFGDAGDDGMELALSSDRFERMNLQRDICGGGKGFCSMVAVDTNAKKSLFNATSNPEKISKMIGKTIDLLHFYVEVIQVVSEQTGEIVNVPRVVLIDSQGKGYHAVSVGMYNSLKRIVSMFGMPDTWDAPLTVEVQQIDVKNGRTFNLLMV